MALKGPNVPYMFDQAGTQLLPQQLGLLGVQSHLNFHKGKGYKVFPSEALFRTWSGAK